MEKAENLTAVSGSIYARPELYDLAFSYRVFEEEFDFLRKAHAKHAPGQVLNSVLELGCGPARHAIGLAKTGVPKVSWIAYAPKVVACTFIFLLFALQGVYK